MADSDSSSKPLTQSGPCVLMPGPASWPFSQTTALQSSFPAATVPYLPPYTQDVRTWVLSPSLCQPQPRGQNPALSASSEPHLPHLSSGDQTDAFPQLGINSTDISCGSIEHKLLRGHWRVGGLGPGEDAQGPGPRGMHSLPTKGRVSKYPSRPQAHPRCKLSFVIHS